MSRFYQELSPADRERLLKRLREVNGHIRERGIGQPRGNGPLWGAGVNADLLTGYSYGEYYDWDLYFENLYLSHFGVANYCRTNLEVFLDRQLACGFVARTLIVPRQRQHFKPFLAQIAVLGARQFGFAWLAGKYYERLAKYLDYWRWFCDFDRNGLSVWDSADHSGMDNQVLRVGPLDTMTVEGVDLNCYIVRELEAMAVIAEALGLAGDAERWTADAAKLAATINEVMYDPADGFYYDRDERTGKLIRVKSASSFTPLWAGVAGREQAERLVRDHLLNPDEFWLDNPLASWSKSEPSYYQQRKDFECTWMGACWVPINYMAAHGLARYGFKSEAHTLAEKTFRMALSEQATREYYDAETGVGQGLNPFWGWSALAYVLPFELDAGYDPTDLRALILPLGENLTGLSF